LIFENGTFKFFFMKQILPTLLFLVISSSVFATHLMGGEITAKQIGPLEYEINMVLY